MSAPGVSAAQIRAEMETITQRLALAYPQENASIHVIIKSLRERVVGQVQTLLWIVFGAVVIVLSYLHDRDALPALKLLAQKHDCVVLQLQDPAEKGMRGGGFLRAREAETGRAFVTRAGLEWVDPKQLAADLRRSGIDHMLIETDKPFAARLRHFCKSRGLLGRGAR